MPVKGSVTITINPDGTYVLDPPKGILDRNIQVMQWSLDAPKGYTFAPDPIVFVNPPPAGYDPWTGETPVRENDWQVRARANSIAPGPAALKYRYDIFYLDPNGNKHQVGKAVEIDPDMENQPEP